MSAVEVPYRHVAAVKYWVEAARDNSKRFVESRRAYRSEQHAHKRGKLWEEGNRCRARIPALMSEARRTRDAIVRPAGGAA